MMLKKKLLALITAVSLVVTSFSGVLSEPVVAEASDTKTITITKDDCMSLSDIKNTRDGEVEWWEFSDNVDDLSSGNPDIISFYNMCGDGIEYYLWIPVYKSCYNITEVKDDVMLKCVTANDFYEIDIKVLHYGEDISYSITKYESSAAMKEKEEDSKKDIEETIEDDSKSEVDNVNHSYGKLKFSIHKITRRVGDLDSPIQVSIPGTTVQYDKFTNDAKFILSNKKVATVYRNKYRKWYIKFKKKGL